mmetsp:Transcript_11108/g.34460  ORF Transcript_11108/g.34460 Transcript_11108/m.34460 type:complete len:240 (-) Transcript_11108:800-1519(-)
MPSTTQTSANTWSSHASPSSVTTRSACMNRWVLSSGAAPSASSAYCRTTAMTASQSASWRRRSAASPTLATMRFRASPRSRRRRASRPANVGSADGGGRFGGGGDDGASLAAPGRRTAAAGGRPRGTAATRVSSSFGGVDGGGLGFSAVAIASPVEGSAPGAAGGDGRSSGRWNAGWSRRCCAGSRVVAGQSMHRITVAASSAVYRRPGFGSSISRLRIFRGRSRMLTPWKGCFSAMIS